MARSSGGGAAFVRAAGVTQTDARRPKLEMLEVEMELDLKANLKAAPSQRD